MSRYEKRSVPMAKHICETVTGDEASQPHDGEIQQLADKVQTHSISAVPQTNPCSITLHSSLLLHAKSTAVKTEEQSQITVSEPTRKPSSGVQTLASGNACVDNRCRKLAISTETFDPKPASQLVVANASDFPQVERRAPEQSCISTPGASSQDGRVIVLFSRPNCRCRCHNQPTTDLRRHEGDRTEVKQTSVLDTGFERISDGFNSEATRRIREKRGAFSQGVTRSRSYEHSDPQDTDDDNVDEAGNYKNAQRLKTTTANRYYITRFLHFC